MALFSSRGFSTTYRPQVQGTDGDDTLFAIAGRGAVFAGEGNDWVVGSNGNDVLYGDNGDDALFGNGGDDRLYGDDGNDYIDGGAGRDTVYGGVGDDVLLGAFGTNTVLYGGEGNDTIYGGHTGNGMAGEAGDDVLHIDGNRFSPNGVEPFVFAAGGEGSDTLVIEGGIDVSSLQAFTINGSFESLFVRWTDANGAFHSGNVNSIEWIDAGNGVQSIMDYVVA